MTYAQLRAAIDQAWIDRVGASVIAAAIAISQDSPSTPLDTRRDALARDVMREPTLWANRFALPVALGFVGGSDLTSVTDGAIDNRVAAVWNDFLHQG